MTAAMNYDRFLSETAKRRRPGALRKAFAKIKKSGLDPSQFVNMCGGMPNSSLFPFASAEFKLRDGTVIHLDENKMTEAMQYGATPGHAPFVKKMREFIKAHHRPPTLERLPEDGGLEFCIVPGAQCGIDLAFATIMNPGENYIVEEPTYVGALGITEAMNCKPLPVTTDEHGMIPSELRKLLERWGPAAVKDPDSDIPKLLYLIPTGTNPSGVTLPEQRRREIYQVARDYDLIIVEDDPYYFLSYESVRPPTFLELDIDGRVIRLDSFSKIVAAGIRLGVASGPEPLIRRMVWHLEVTVTHAPGLCQILVDELLDSWGSEGFDKQIERCRGLYRKQRDLVVMYAEKYLKGLAEWVVPTAGLFLWIKIFGVEDTSSFIDGTLTKQLVLFAPGFAFMTDQEKPSSYIRVSFSNVAEAGMDKAFRCLADAIREEFVRKQNGIK